MPNRGGRNVSTMERIPSAVAGAALMAYGLSRRNLPGVIMAVAGSEMLYRGATGRCPVYGALGVNTAPQDGNPNATVFHNQSIQVKKSVTIDKPVEHLYMFWRNLQNLPKFMRHLEAVEIIDDTHSHWVANAPAGRMVEWDAEIINEKPNELIAWKSMPGTAVPNAGSVLFEKAPDGRGTVVIVEMDYMPPAGPLGAMVARMFGEEPAMQIEEDLCRFKMLMEEGPAELEAAPPAGKMMAMGRKKSSKSDKASANGHAMDTVQEASEESFPASDAPAWT
ncbi:MAG TPA: SRPBCC family protein [Capsulimonadaceae bacterium]|nr:SRPBCC family protein [Capsulimonadaceae bacterium]